MRKCSGKGETYNETSERNAHVALFVPEAENVFCLWRLAALEVIIKTLNVYTLR